MVKKSETKSSNEEFGFTHWVADNGDHNIATLDGKGGFHGMGVIACFNKTNTLGLTKQINSAT